MTKRVKESEGGGGVAKVMRSSGNRSGSERHRCVRYIFWWQACICGCARRENKVTKQGFGEEQGARDDVLACPITATEIGRRSAGDLATATKVAGQRLHGARDAPLFWRSRTAPDYIPGRRIWRGRGNRRSSRPRRFERLLGAGGWCRLWNGGRNGEGG